LAELVDNDFNARAKLADVITSWTALHALVGFYSKQFGQEILAPLVEHIEALRVLTSSWLSEVKTKTEEFFLKQDGLAGRKFFQLFLSI